MNNKIEKALRDLSEGKMIIITDDESRENEGDLVMDAAMVNDQSIAFMVREGKGLVCVPITRDTAARLLLHQMVDTNQDRHGTAFTVSVDASDCTTGISAAERAHTITVLARPD
ncbi:MAG TPA: 3,4-dihydroxy-2-butanone-4-phosphate synthase, partial [Treponemataceae bacterium]|nr:3,4-dihydroxy-2-butanone-4-phosphate synthase [Treponemataceae bacterium]